MEWSETWEWQGKEFIRCKECEKAMPTEFKERHKCGEEKQKGVSDFKKASELPPVEEDVGELVRIAKQLATDLGKEGDIGKLTENEHAWVSTIYIQRKRA